jgi:hypothetical protein
LDARGHPKGLQEPILTYLALRVNRDI